MTSFLAWITLLSYVSASCLLQTPVTRQTSVPVQTQVLSHNLSLDPYLTGDVKVKVW